MTEHERAPVRFGLFDWLDESGRGQGETYEERLRMLELADRLDFYAYHLAEHHATELSTVPSPNVFLSAVAQRTERLRFGSLSYILPLYDPVRLLEEICMLDQLSGGRVELGLSRGSFGEHIEGDPEKARAMFNEGLQVMLGGISTGEIDFQGSHYSFAKVITRLRPVQRPYPPLWYPTSNVGSVPWVAGQGLNAVFSVHLAPNFERVAEMVQRYWSELDAHADDPGRLNAHVPDPKVGFMVHIHVAETDALALEQAKPAYELFAHNFSYRYVRRGQPERYADRRNFEHEIGRTSILVGSPETVRNTLQEMLRQSGANYVVGCFSFGSLTSAQTLNSLQLFASEVIPALSGLLEHARN
ncbi:MAG: LLM class flavin-dependent oxidoreductase [Chloroflexi bacterium]|nr:LLM class flavin-dependent oxidoreductase [Chloroflexota bacterium]